MHDLLSMILSQITTHPDDVQIHQSEEDGREVYTIHVHPDDMGRVIGKSGKVIQAIRSLAHVVAIRQNTRYRINVAESDDNRTSASDDPAMSDDPSDAGSDDAQAQADIDETVEDTSAADLISGAIDLGDMDEEEA